MGRDDARGAVPRDEAARRQARAETQATSAAIAAQIVGHFFTRGRENRRFRIEAFERFRREFMEDKELRQISKKYYDDQQPDLTDEEIERYLDFFEDLGLYVSRKLIDLEMVDESLGDYVMDCYENNAFMRYIATVRGEERDYSYWEHFEHLGRSLVERRKRRRAK